MPSIADLNKKYAGKTYTSPPPKPSFLQKAGGFAAGVGKAIASPFARLGVEGYNVASGINKATHGDLPGATAALDKPRNLPLLGPTKPTLTNSSKPGLNQAADVAGQGIQLGADFAGAGGLGSGVMAGVKTGAALGATQGFGSALTETQGKSFGQNVGNIAEQTGIGGLTGGAIGGAVNAIHPIFTRSTPIMNPDLVASSNKYIQAGSERGQAAAEGVRALNQVTEKVGQFKSDLGTNFAEGAKQLESTNPTTKLVLSNKTLDSLNNLKESKNFALPEGLDQESNPLLGSQMSKDVLAKNSGKLAEIQNAGKVELTHTQAQDLIKRLNKLTFDAKASGDLAVNQQTIGLTSELKQAASQTFGPEWDKLYSNYSKGIKAVESLDDIVNLNNATASDLNKSLNSVLKLGETPEGKLILNQAVEEFKNTSGIDLTDPVKAMHQILDKELALQEAKSNLNTAQKQATVKAEKGGFGKQFVSGALSPQYLGKRLIEGGAIFLFLYPALRKLQKALGL